MALGLSILSCSNIDLLDGWQDRLLRRHLAWYLSFSLSWKTAVLRFTQGLIRRRPGPGRRSHNSHAVERAVNEEERNQKECQCQSVAQSGTGFQPQLHGKLNRKQSEQSCEFDHRIHRHRGRILEGIAHRIADDRGIVQRRAFLFQFNFHNFFGIVPGAAGVRHENSLVQPEYSDRDQISNEVEGLDKCKRQRSEKDREEYIEHALLRVLRANLHNFLAVRNRSLLHSFQPDIRFDEFDCPVSARRYGLRGSAGKPVNHCSAGDQSQNKWRMQERKIANVFCQTLGQRHDDRKNHRRSTHYGRSNQHWLRSCLKCIAGAIIVFVQVLSALEVHINVEISLEILLGIRNLFDQRKLINRLRVVGHWPVRIDSNRHRSHSQKSKRHQTKGEHWRRHHQRTQTHCAEVVSDGHQNDHRKSEVVSREISCHKAGKNIQRRSALLGRNHYFFHVPRFRRSEYFQQLRDHCSR